MKIMNNRGKKNLQPGDVIIESGKYYYMAMQNGIDMDDHAYLVALPTCEVIAIFNGFEELNKGYFDYIYGDTEIVSQKEITIIIN